MGCTFAACRCGYGLFLCPHGCREQGEWLGPEGLGATPLHGLAVLGERRAPYSALGLQGQRSAMGQGKFPVTPPPRGAGHGQE